ncbi:MAG: hypothetical protein HC854_14305 [Flavobacterium sp.]|nr:hypothetical protein [Flavobacterium sp.]
MEQRDYIESIIEQLGNSLKRMLSFLIKENGKNNEIETITSIENDFLTNFKISIEELVLLSDDDFKIRVLNLKLKENHIETLSKLFFQLSFQNKRYTIEQKLKLKEKALLLLDIANFVSNSFSIERFNMKNEILKS